jgi:hypothetical protein
MRSRQETQAAPSHYITFPCMRPTSISTRGAVFLARERQSMSPSVSVVVPMVACPGRPKEYARKRISPTCIKRWRLEEMP